RGGAAGWRRRRSSPAARPRPRDRPSNDKGRCSNMPMITERLKRLRLPLGGMAAALFVWFAGMAAVAYAFDPAAVIVFASGQIGAPSVIALADGRLLRSGFG